MKLLNLPPELLVEVFDLVGASFFYDDIQRLTICKQWYCYARGVFLTKLKLTAKSLGRFLSLSDETMKNFKPNLRTLELKFRGFDGLRSRIIEDRGIDDAGFIALDESILQPYKQNWIRNFTAELLELGDRLRDCALLDSLHLHTPTDRPPTRIPGSFIPWSAILRLLLLKNSITSLEVNIRGNYIMETDPRVEFLHICPSIASLLPRLRRLRLCMLKLCSDVLRLPKNTMPTSLEDVIIDISMGEPIADRCWVKLTSCHEDPFETIISTHESDMNEQAGLLAAQMFNPKIFRIVTEWLPSKPNSFNVLTGEKMRLPYGAAWDDDGALLDEEGRILK